MTEKTTASRLKPSRKILSASLKLSDLIDLNYNLLWVIDRVGLGFGFGDDTIEEACTKRGLNYYTFILICNIYTYDGYVPTLDMLHKTNLEELVNYLHNSHSYYTDTAVKQLKESIDVLLEDCENKYKQIIKNFYSEYEREILKHFDYEEKTVFPYVRDVLSMTNRNDYSIREYEENHTDIEEKLNDLKNIIMKYVPYKSNSTKITNVLFNIYRLEDDLDKHTYIEEDILMPIVHRIEDEHKTGINK